LESQFFTTLDGRPLDWVLFLDHKLGKLYQAIPFDEIASILPYKKPKTGPVPWFDVKGGIGLQILKHHYRTSDENLIDLLNQNKMMQYFCGINLKAGQKIKDIGIVSRWRARLGGYLAMSDVMTKFQLANVEHWKSDLENTETNLSDATCYESYIRYPTDVKLLWECITYLRSQMKKICKYVGIKMPRSKFKDQERKYLSYQKRRKKTYKLTRATIRRLLYLLHKFLGLLPGLIGAMKRKEAEALHSCRVKSNFFSRISTIKKIYEQQQLHFNYPKLKIKNRIVSLHKPYLRPIVRGKETKRVEFGMKVHEMQVDGINIIEHWNFEAYHEGVRMKKTTFKHRYLFKKKCTVFGGDQIYANNKNRKYCARENISTCFQPKGRPPVDKTVRKQQSQLRSLIGKERATRLEGSFGNKKNHYLLDKIKAKTFNTEIAWIFFGNMTANAINIAKRNKPPSQKVAA